MLNIVVILECVTENAHAAVYVALLYSIRHTTALVRGAPIQYNRLQQAWAPVMPRHAQLQSPSRHSFGPRSANLECVMSATGTVVPVRWRDG